MKIIKYPNNEILSNLGNPPIFDTNEYRFMKYCINVNVDEGILIYNYLTRALVLLTEEDINNLGDIKKYDFMYKWYFLVSPDFDEQLIVDTLRERFRIPQDDLYLDHPSTFTILSTTKCNARCFYCYENGLSNKRHMTLEVAEQVADYINKVAYNHINLAWFGGEPLFNMKVIDKITNKLHSYNREFTSSMTTNGYLFNKDIIIKAKNTWNLRTVQITIDGPEQIYNQVKNYIDNPKVSPYQKVLNNIATLLNIGIQVNIRLNIDLYNKDDLRILVEELCNRFGNHPNLVIYQFPIFDDSRTIDRTKEENIRLFKAIKEIDDYLDSKGFFTGKVPNSMLPSSLCKADDGNSVLIGVDGKLGTCEHYIHSNFWGHISNPDKKDFKELGKWREYNKLEICNSCPLYAECIKPTYCKEMGKCDEFTKERLINQHKKGIIHLYRPNNNNNILNYKRLNENIWTQ